MINRYDIPQPKTGAIPDAFLISHGAVQRINDLHAEADVGRLARQFRKAHPELGMRYRTAVALRRLADRIAPEPAPQQVQRPRIVRI